MPRTGFESGSSAGGSDCVPTVPQPLFLNFLCLSLSQPKFLFISQKSNLQFLRQFQFYFNTRPKTIVKVTENGYLECQRDQKGHLKDAQWMIKATQ